MAVVQLKYNERARSRGAAPRAHRPGPAVPPLIMVISGRPDGEMRKARGRDHRRRLAARRGRSGGIMNHAGTGISWGPGWYSVYTVRTCTM